MADELEHLTASLTARYRLERRLGKGAMATVYLAEDLKHDRKVAVKVLRPELAAALGRDRFLREIGIAAKLAHPHILPLYDSGQTDVVVYYVMPYVAGESLRDRLSREKQLPIDEAVQIARQVADALASAHRHGIVHRDIKPENILLQEGHAVVSDFGIARALTVAGAERLTETGIAVGTPTYMSPEQGAAEWEIDGRSDVYSLGCVLYEMLAGDPPFTGSSAQAILARKAVEPAPSLLHVRRTVPLWLSRALERALATAPADRYATADDFAADLAPRPSRVRRRHASLAALVGLSTLGLTAAAWWLGSDRRHSATHIERLAVLSFANLTGDGNQEYFVEGMQDALIGELSQIAALSPISRQSTLRYRGTTTPLRQIAQELDVEALVVGSVFRAGDSVRITVQLIATDPQERTLWTGTYRRHLRDILALNSEVAQAIAQQIEITVTPTERLRLTVANPVNPGAHDAWLRGWNEFSQRTRGSLSRCIEQANRALALDPRYAPAFDLAAGCYGMLTYSGETSPREAFPKARAAAERAVELDETMAGPHATLGWTLAVYEWDWQAAEREFRRALQLEPGSARTHALFGFFLAWLGRSDEALAHARRAEELNPLSAEVSQVVAAVLYGARRYDEAIVQAFRTIDLAPGFGFAYNRLGVAYEAQGKYEMAVEAWEKAATLMGDVRRKGFLGRAYALAGRRDDASRLLAELLSLERTSYVPPVAIAAIYVGLGDKGKAITWLEKGYHGRDGDMVLLKTWAMFDPLRSEPSFQRLLERMEFPD